MFYGLDFGFTNDPTALTQVVLAHGDLYFKQIIYKRGLTNIKNPANPKQESIQEKLEENNIPKNARIWADSAEPKSIADLNGCGYYNLKATTKGPDSVKAGIDIMLRYNIWITEDSIDMIKEKNNYKWKEDRAGNATNEPMDNWNHSWDGSRYGCFMELNPRNSTWTPLSIEAPSKWK
jgi:phage terminase large subunit